jgi:hypothetical protein
MPRKSEQPTMVIAETPGGHPVLEAVEKTPPKPLTEKQLSKKIAKIDAEITKCDDGHKVFEEQLETLKKSFLEVKTSQGKEIDTLLEGVATSSSKKLLDEVLQLSTPRVAQLTENISKVGIAAQNIQRKRHKLHLEKKEIEKQITDINSDREAKATFEGIGAFLEAYRAAEGAFNALKDLAFQCSDMRYASRAKNLGFSPAFEVIADSHLKPANLPRLSMREFVDMVADLGSSYGPVLIEKDFDRQNDVPLAREKFIADYGAYGATK